MALTAISLYTGVGGLDFGFEAAGFKTRVAVEMDAACCRAIRRNRPSWTVLEKDIHDLEPREILRASGLRPGEADVVIGGPPCQPFSKSGYWSTGDALRLEDPRADTLGAYLRVLLEAQPRAFLLENVGGLAFKGKSEGLTYLLEGVEEINRRAGTAYKVRFATLNAADYGVPQMRERVFLIAGREGETFEFPEPTHGSADPADLFETSREPHLTAWDAIGDLPPDPEDPALVVRGKWGALLPTIPEGENYLWHTPRGDGFSLFGWRTRYWSFLLKLAKDRPAWTIQAQPGTATGPFHWRSRRLTAHEMCRIQTFPEGLHFEASRNEVQRMLGNAVPSALAELLAREIKWQIVGVQRRRRPLKLLPERKGTPPDAEVYLTELPEQYRAYEREHEDHPGEGRGPSAVRRGDWSQESLL